MPRSKTADRGLHFERTRYRPGLGICSCKRCLEEADRLRRIRCPVPPGQQFAGCEYVNPEEVFSEEWEAECIGHPGTNHGLGILEALMMIRETDRSRLARGFDLKPFLEVTDRDRLVAATAIQWLGSNCGFAFLKTVLERCGYRVVPDENARREAGLRTKERLARARRRRR